MNADRATIYALSSAPGKAGVSVVRVSGTAAWLSLTALAGLQNNQTIIARQAILRPVRAPETGETIDQALILPFKGPASFTGEDVVEYHLHGSVAVVEAFLAALARQPHHRLAEPGEFTRRAFENGKLDLTEAEAVADLINAETQAQRQQALSQMGGALSRLYNGWREELVRALAYVEAVIDFPDEDVPDSETAKARPAIEAIATSIRTHVQDNRRGEILRNGVQIALIGAPNAGKSSLINALTRRDVAIVSPMAGTTRDVIEAHLDLGGYPVILADTAGLRPDQITEDGRHGSVESEGIRRAIERAEKADIRILLFDATEQAPDPHTLALRDDKALIVLNKSDAAPAAHITAFQDKLHTVITQAQNTAPQPAPSASIHTPSASHTPGDTSGQGKPRPSAAAATGRQGYQPQPTPASVPQPLSGPVPSSSSRLSPPPTSPSATPSLSGHTGQMDTASPGALSVPSASASISSEGGSFALPLESKSLLNPALGAPAASAVTPPPAAAGTSDIIVMSVKTGDGLDKLLALLTRRIGESFAVSRETPSLTRARHRAALEECLDHLQAALCAPLPELMAEDLRIASRALGRITGRVDVEDLLDVIFRDFCIGK